MFRSGDIVLYRLDVSQIKQIKQEKDRTFYLLYSLGSEYCEFKVPCDNAGGHLQSLPSKQTLEHYLDEMADLVCFEIPRNPGFQYYQNILNSVDLRDWCALLKTLYRNRCNALENGKRFNQKQSQYYEYVLENWQRSIRLCGIRRLIPARRYWNRPWNRFMWQMEPDKR